MTKDEALKLALEALEVANSCVDGYYIPKGKTQLPEVEEAITAIKEALAQPEQEPVIGTKTWFEDGKVVTQYLYPSDIYTTPPQPEQEPVEWPRTMERGALVQWLHFEMVQHTLDEGTIDKLIEDAQAIPATPPQRTWVGLTESDISDVCASNHPLDGVFTFARAIEAKLKERNT